ncbi:MAG: hypothetical protein EDR02_01935 [Actinobacteria bacterium]|nr:MAG: hypothetical protein EDR02_01935 [Actinomycetota bacterium]
MSEDLPPLDQEDIDHLAAVPKPVVDSDWLGMLRPHRRRGINLVGRYDLPESVESQALKGTLHLYARLNQQYVADYSTGLVFTDGEGNSYRILRCNGPHRHYNSLEGQWLADTPHVHHVTERYLMHPNMKHDGYAEISTDFNDLDSAIRHLADRVGLQADGFFDLFL